MADTSPYAGSWRVARRIVHFDDGRVWTFIGRAEIHGRSFVEEGQMTTEGVSLPAMRRYGLDWDGTARVAVRRVDGSTLVTLSHAPLQDVTHQCGPDLYEGRLLFPDPHCWMEVWRVRGPRRNDRSLTRYTRL